MIFYFYTLFQIHLKKFIYNKISILLILFLFLSIFLDKISLLYFFKTSTIEYKIHSHAITLSINNLITRLALFYIIGYFIKIDIESNYHSYIFLNRRYSSIFLTTIIYLLSLIVFFIIFISCSMFLYYLIFDHKMNGFQFFNYGNLFYLIPNVYIYKLSNSKIEKFLCLMFIIPISNIVTFGDEMFGFLFTSFYASKMLKNNIKI